MPTVALSRIRADAVPMCAVVVAGLESLPSSGLLVCHGWVSCDEKKSPAVASGAPRRQLGYQCLQSGNPAASGGLVVLELEPAEVELVLLPVLLVLGLVLLPLLVLGVSFRTCFVALSQHFTLLEDVALDGGVVVVGVCATARPKLPVSIAATINPIPAIRMRHPS